ncbi:hypothetical protein ABPG72_018038 [Tetrahymena utriculariae]
MCFKYLSKIDIFGSRISLRFKGESTYKSRLGSTVTLCIFGIIIFRLIQIVISIHQRENPILTYQERQVDNPAQFIANSMTSHQHLQCKIQQLKIIMWKKVFTLLKRYLCKNIQCLIRIFSSLLLFGIILIFLSNAASKKTSKTSKMPTTT